MTVSVEELNVLVAEELRCLSDPARRRQLQIYLHAPELISVAWDYGQPNERHDVWIVGQSRDGELLLVYSDVGFGPQFPWGSIRRGADSLGMDSQWHSGLEDAAICCRLLGTPPGYVVPGPRSD
jgi:hypothetical protein